MPNFDVMSAHDDPSSTRPQSEPSTERDELRTIAFRVRELQRLLAIRVEQENRRLEADGIDPVTNTRFLEEHPSDE